MIVPKVERKCEQGSRWDMLLKKSLSNLVEGGKVNAMKQMIRCFY